MIYISAYPVKETKDYFLNSQPLVLASTSPYRRELLARLQIPFQTAAPEVDETALPDEHARQTAWRLSRKKAQAIATLYPDALIIGSDQVALLGEQQLGKPVTHDNAVRQLRAMNGKTVIFHTALTLLNARNGEMQTEVAENRVSFRELDDDKIESYLRKEQPYNCAGSAKSEGLGIALISRMEGDDPNALIGLPLILLISMLEKQNFLIL
ncbi:MAG: septum formation inhibitor Maf [Nitrosomonadales bacterium]|nr:septum formation inhibitor Maf [Nitrosomonadales bacterium]